MPNPDVLEFVPATQKRVGGVFRRLVVGLGVIGGALALAGLYSTGNGFIFFPIGLMIVGVAVLVAFVGWVAFGHL